MKNLFENWRRFVISEGEDLNWSAKCIIFDDAGRIMLVEVANKGTLDYPGGHGENSETPIDAVKREVFEEIGLKIDQITQIGKIPAEVPRYLFAAMNFSGTFDLQYAEVSDYLWVSIDELMAEVNHRPKKFESTVVLTVRKYLDLLRQLESSADKTEYHKMHALFDPDDYEVR